MYITELEIDNFKSFAKKTKIPFYEGFTVVSGPNGSGKSNIIDSILFCLALSSARTLRAEKLTDFINLNNSKNTAEVSITFSDNTKISRKIKRTSQNYYSYNYLNNRLCKQSDITEYLARHGIKAEGYNVVMQGDITRIIEMSDTERRKIIDEIAGVAEFDKKKEQSLKELDIVRERIEREELLLDELNQRLSVLETEKAQAEKYVELNRKLDELKMSLSAAKLRDCESELSNIALLEDENNEKLSDLAKKRFDADLEAAGLRDKITELDNEIALKSGDEYRELLASIEQKKGEINFAKQNIVRLNQAKETKKESITKLFAETRQAETRVAELTDEIRKLSIDRSNLNMELSGLNSELENVQKELDKRSSTVEGARERLIALMSAIDAKKDEKSSILSDQSSLIERSRMRTEEKDRTAKRIEEIDADIVEKSEPLASHEKLVESLSAEKVVLDGNISQSERKLFENRKKLEDVRDEYRKQERELTHIEAQQRASGGPVGKGLEVILGMDGVYGTVGQLGKAPTEYAVALSTAAGGRMSNVVCESDRVAADGINYLRQNQLGRATFLPVNKLRAPELPPLTTKKVIDYAVNLLNFDPIYDVVFRYVFGSTVVVKDLDTARSMIGQYRMVTLSGEIVEKAGAMTGGSQNRKMALFGVSADDEIEKIRLKMAELSQEDSLLSSAVERLTKDVEESRNRRSEIDAKLTEASYLVRENKSRIADLTDEKESLTHRLAEMTEEVRVDSEKLVEIEEKLSEIGKELSKISAERDKLNRDLNDTGIPELTTQYESLRKRVTDEKNRLDKKDFNIQDSQMQKKYFISRVEELKANRENAESEISKANNEISELNSSIAECELSVLELNKKLESFSDELKVLQSKRQSLNDELFTKEKRIIEIDGESERIHISINSLSERKGVLVEQVEVLRIEAGDVRTDLSLSEITTAIEKTNKDLGKIGAVNMLAIEEYDNISRRIADKTEKKEVLSKERATIIERIDYYAKMKHDTFMSAYSAIDTNFQKIFARLTEGKGSLSLENEEDPFIGGMTFSVQPREKNVHLLSSLSGGEKSLTTLAFIFAIQQYMPAPFYALDEIDMMLDGSNVERVSSMIAELSANAQTICVSLRKPTIDRSDRMVGVTIRPDKSTYVTGVKNNG